jgi:hypothetical protein
MSKRSRPDEGAAPEVARQDLTSMVRAVDLPDRMPRDDAGLKALAKQLGCAKKDLLVLAPNNDPFNVDLPAKRRNAEWFAGLWHDFGYTNGVYTRRVHYHAAVKHAGEIMRPDGAVYLNDIPSWVLMVKAAIAARDFGIIDPALFTDKRNPRTSTFTQPRIGPAEPSWEISGTEVDWSDPYVGSPEVLGLRLLMPGISLDLGSVEVDGYDYQAGDQPYLTELWIEKSTMDDVLIPLCAQLHVNYTVGKGFTSRTRVVEMLHRAREHGKPLRVFVISDYDPAGSAMPRSIARVIEFYREQFAPDVEVALCHIGMTRDWVDRYDLPRAPIAASESNIVQGRTDNFEVVHGGGAVELDALEVFYPGALAEEITEAISAYRDPGLSTRLRAAEREAHDTVGEEWHAITQPIRDEVGQIRAEVNAVRDRFQPRVDELRAEMDAEINPLLAPYRRRAEKLSAELVAEIAPQQERAEELDEELRDLADELDVTLPDRPDGDASSDDESGWLYDSRRHWQDQLDRFHRDRDGGASS